MGEQEGDIWPLTRAFDPVSGAILSSEDDSLIVSPNHNLHDENK